MRVLLVEDDPLLGEGVSHTLRREGMSTEWLKEGANVAATLKHSPFDVLVLDLGLPDLDGLQVLSHLRRQGQTLPVLILTARDDISDRVRGLDGGADDYLVKPFDIAELVARLRALVRRHAGQPSGCLQLGPLRIDQAGRTVTLAGSEVALGRREFDLLEFLLLHPSRVFSRDQLVEQLYGWDGDVESNVIEVHVHHLRRKFGTGVVKTVRGVGYRLGELT
ncbi:response regulator [Cobetia amphilecti]|uniref:response regulator n=1 Tax=Cobetia amphilecti TaxID=1055104 RepID=UPI00336C449A